MGGELLSFDEALAELQMATHELRSLVAQGEIRAFRDDDSLKFRRTDVLDLKKSRDVLPDGLVIDPDEFGDDTLPALEPGEPVPGPEVMPPKHETEETELLTGIGEDAPTDFLGLDDAGESDGVGGDTAQTVVPTIEIADEDIIDDTAQTVIPSFSADNETDILSDSETFVPPTAPPLLVEEDEATEMATQEIHADDLVQPAAAAVDTDAETVAEEEPLRFQDTSVGTDDLEVTTDEISASATSLAGTGRSQQYQEQAAAVTSSPVFLALAITTFIVLLFGIPIFYGIATDSAPSFAPYDSLVKFLAENFN